MFFYESEPEMAASSSRHRVGYRFDPTQLPVGYRFHPTEEELVDHFLRKKMQGHAFNEVPEVDICKHEPWDLPAFSPLRSDDEEWFYFTRPDYKSGKKQGQANRATERGFWKITAKEGTIRARGSKAVIGKKRILTFYTGKVRSGQKTSWGIHEYYIPETQLPNAASQRDFVLCRLKKKDESTNIGACDEGEPSTNNASDFQNFMEVFGRQSIPEDLQITLQENTRRPEEIFDTLFPSPESPQLHNFSSMLGDNFMHANAVSDEHLELQYGFRPDDSEDEEFNVNSYLVDDVDYSLEETSRTTRLNHSSEPKSVLKVYDEVIHQQGMSSPVASNQSVQDTNVMLLEFLQKNASSVNVAASLPRTTKLQADFGNDMLSRTLVTDKSSFNETGLAKGGIFITERAEKQSGPAAFPLQPNDYITPRRVRPATAQSDALSIKRGHNPQKVKNESKLPEKPMAPPSNDEEESMKQKQTGTTISDWKSSFIVWKESPLSLRSYPPVVYICYMIIGLILFRVFVGELISYGKWY